MLEETYNRKKKYSAGYNRKTYRHISFTLRKDVDKNVIEFLDAKSNKGQYIRDLILADMAR